MLKRGSFSIKSAAVANIFLIVFASVSFAFILSESGRVDGQAGATEDVTLNGNPAHRDPATGNIYDYGGMLLSLGPSPSGALTTPGSHAGLCPGCGKTPTETTPAGEEGFFGSLFGAKPFGVTGVGGALLSGLIWGGIAYGVGALIGSLFGLDDGAAQALSAALGIGVFAGRFAFTSGFASTTGAVFLTLGIAAFVFILFYSEESKQAVKFQCLPFEPSIGGKDCEKCNNDPFRPCSEYRCRSLGQACEIVNAGTEDEKCVWVNPNDAASPTITPWDTPLTKGHKYTSHDERPPARGTKIVRDNVANGCLQAFTPLTFGIVTNEPAQCKIDIAHTNSSDTMQYYIGSNLFLYNHTQSMSLPSPGAVNAEAPQLKNDGRYNLFIRCRDKNGNENVDEYAVQFCVDPSPDTTPPIIVDTSIKSGNPVSFGASTVPLEVYVNEPSNCKWSKQDKAYDEMETAMTCATSLTQINARELYTCATTLTGVQDRVSNSFYFRCKDQPNKPENSRNVNVNSYNFTLKGSQPLNIISTAPNETITGSTTSVSVELKVTTDDGAEEGKALCSFSSTGEVGSFIEMFETNKFEHKQTLQLGSGSYTYYFRCVDLGGNSATASTSFTVLVDTQPPSVTRAYHDQANNALKIVTNEEATCVYSLNSCNYNFAEGVAMPYANPSMRRNHYAEWQPNIIYSIKCKDDFGNEPAPNSCSLIASATNIG